MTDATVTHSRPQEQRGMLLRPRLLCALGASSEHPLVLVTGPAGSGKTTTVLQWLSGLGPQVRVGWLTTTERDNHPNRFWARFAESVSRACPEFGWLPAPFPNPTDGRRLEQAVDQLAGIDPPVVLVLDDIHLVAHPEVLRGLDLIASRLPESVVLTLVGRARPPLRLARRAAAHELVELRGSDLMFSLSETKALLRHRQGSLSSTASAHLVHAATGGWPVAVALAAARASADQPVTARDVQVARTEVGRFLAEEVLGRQPAAVQRFMLDTSVLDGVTVAGANRLRGATDAGPHLDHLDRHQLVLPAPHAEGDAEVWHQHVLLRDFLRARMAEREPERWVLLRRRAARLAAEEPKNVPGGTAGPGPTPAEHARPAGPRPAGPAPTPLSARELEVLRMLRSEYSLPEIARHLFVSYNTAKTHTQTIYRKLGVSTRSSAVQRARELGYLDRPNVEPAAARSVPPRP